MHSKCIRAELLLLIKWVQMRYGGWILLQQDRYHYKKKMYLFSLKRTQFYILFICASMYIYCAYHPNNGVCFGSQSKNMEGLEK